ncbi:recombinase family protein [Nonomuraea fuscirosea]|uniref:recombinase family protein n=1 Tax=Nonomuraea fuscirosea TaxID=1291556 RepID=UPI003717B296
MGVLIGYANIYLDERLAGTNQPRPALDQTLAAVHAVDTWVAAKSDRFYRSAPDIHGIGDALTARGLRLSGSGLAYALSEPISYVFFSMLAVIAEFEVDLPKMRTREGMAIARSHGRHKGWVTRLIARQQSRLVRMRATRDYVIAELMDVFLVGRATVHRVLDRTSNSPNGSRPGAKR